jgi:hypothetical protein
MAAIIMNALLRSLTAFPVAYFEVLFQRLPRWTDETKKSLSYNNRSPSKNPYPGFSKY